MKEKVLEILKNSNKALSLEEIYNLLELKNALDLQKLKEELDLLVKDLEVYRSNKDKYMLFSKSSLKKGVLRVNKKGFGFVEVDGEVEDIYISLENINNAINNDIVLVEVLKSYKNKIEGKVLRILKRELKELVGEAVVKGDTVYVDPDDNKYRFIIEIPKDKAKCVVDQHKVLVKPTKQISGTRYHGELLKIIGHKNDPGTDILSIVYKYNINDTFPEEVEEELKSIPDEVLEKDKVGRVDLTNENIFTIDGDDTKDIDDAISIKKYKNNHFQLGVHIADVSYYVKEGTALDTSAMDRATSVYLVDRVIPMIPHQLSNGICSLNPEVERLTISCVMEIDDTGKIVDYDIFQSFIKSRKQMTYKNVNKILEDNEIVEGYENYLEDLQNMHELSKVLRKNKLLRGYLDFDVDEAKILVDEVGKPTDIILRNRGVGEKIIEDFMIIANECVASHIYFMELPFIYRVHEYPKEEDIREFISFLSTLSYTYNANLKDLSPKSVQRILNFIKDKKEFKILSSLLLRNMKKAVYKNVNLGHYGLASKCYTHFTSPIRRYPDTTVHRLLRTYLFDKKIDEETTNYWNHKLIYVSENSSARERDSISCEREVEDMKMAEYMEEHIGEDFEGMITSITNFGMFIELDNLVEGLVKISEMKEFMRFNEENMTMYGEKSKMTYKLGEKVLVKVKRASKEEKTIDFEIIKKIID